MKDQMGDRFKRYEAASNIVLPRRTNTIIRVDGKAFHTFVRGLSKPYDNILATALVEAMKTTAQGMQGCVLAYRQSDEISFLLQDYNKPETDAWFDGKVQKMASVCASSVTAYFNRRWEEFTETLVGISNRVALFDARVFTIPDTTEVANYFLWRNKDAYRNALSMYFQNLNGHKWCQNRSTRELAGLLTKEEYGMFKKDFWNGTTYEVKSEHLDTPNAAFPHWDELIKEVLPGGVIGNTADSESVIEGSSPSPAAT